MRSRTVRNARVHALVLLLFVLLPGAGMTQTIRIDRAPFLFDAIREGDVRKVSALLEHGAPIDARNDSRSTPLMVAAAMGHIEGARVNVTNREGFTALGYWEAYSRADVAALLEEHGAE